MKQRETVKYIFGGLIPVILLGFYVFAIVRSIQTTQQVVDRCNNNVSCMQKNRVSSEGFETVLNVVGGLVSALVVAELAITQRGELPSAQILQRNASKPSKKVATVISMAYIITWLLCGVASVAVYILHPNAVPLELSEFAKSWLGLAIASAYSYLGIR